MKKVFFSNFKNQLVDKEKRTAIMLYENSHQNGSDDWNFGNLPKISSDFLLLVDLNHFEGLLRLFIVG